MEYDQGDTDNSDLENELNGLDKVWDGRETILLGIEYQKIKKSLKIDEPHTIFWDFLGYQFTKKKEIQEIRQQWKHESIHSRGHER